MRIGWMAAGLAVVLATAGAGRADTDPTGDTYNGPPVIDLNELSACQTATNVVLRLGFVDAVSLYTGGTPTANTVVGYVDIDVDRNVSTGDESSLVQYGPPGAGTDLGVDAKIDLTTANPGAGTIGILTAGSGETTVPMTYTDTSITVAVPIALLGAGAGGVNLGTVIGTTSDPTDAAPNTGVVNSDVTCCGNGTVEPGEACDGGCCLADCSGGDVAQCDDGDPCFDDSCDFTSGCAHTDRTGFPGATCAFERALPTLCAGATVDTKLAAKAKALVEQASSSEKTAAKKLKKAKALLKKAVKKVQRLAKKGRLDQACADAVVAQLQDASSRIERLQ